MCWLQLLCINFEFSQISWLLSSKIMGKGRILESEPVTAEVSSFLTGRSGLLGCILSDVEICWFCDLLKSIEKMKKGIHPQMQWISYVTQSGRLMHVMMTKIHQAGKVYHFRARRQMAESVGQVAKFKRRYGQMEEEKEDESK
ncbi:hypothetical protein L1887_25865 [Cichorium endivia]|nr:hypothetical protein L1887_25865 [Cichorium endivia]